MQVLGLRRGGLTEGVEFGGAVNFVKPIRRARLSLLS